MRWLPLLALCVASCSPYELHEAAVGDKTPREVGFDYELAHVPTTGFARLRPGIFVVGEPREWESIFQGVSRDFAMPRPPDVDWKTSMALIATAGDANATAMQIERVIKTKDDVLHVYVNEELRGDRCLAAANANVLRAEAHEPPIDVVTLPKSKDRMVVHLDRAKGASCDPVPKVAMRCNIRGKAPNEMSATLEAAPGDVVDCDGSNVTTAVGFIAERNWYFEHKPADSFTVMTPTADGTHASFNVDAFGEYRVRMEAVDDRHKTGDKTVGITVAPAPETQIIQIGWTLHDKVDPATLPKTEPHLIEMGTGRECSEATPQPPWCEVKVVGGLRQFYVRTQRGARYRLQVGYLDARSPQQPVLCARAFIKGSTAALETCDYKEHEARDVWEPGLFNPDTGAFGKL